MTTKPRFAPDDPVIQAAFDGIYRSSEKIFFRSNSDGRHQQIPVFRALDTIDITHQNKTDLIGSFPFEHRTYCSERMKAAALAKANKKLKPVRTVEADGDDDDIEDEPEADAQSVNSKKSQYSLVHQNNGYWGCYDAREATVVLFKTIQQAKDYIEALLHGRDGFKAFYGNKVEG